MFQGSSLTIWWPSEIQLSHTKYEFLLITHKNIFFFKEKEKKKSRERGKEWDLELKLTGLGWWGLLGGYTVEAEWHTQAYSLCFFFKPVTTNTWALHQQPLTSYRPELNQEKPVLILSEGGSTVGLSDRFQQSNSFRKAWLKTFHFYCLTYMHFRILKSHLKKERKIMYISFSYLMWL